MIKHHSDIQKEINRFGQWKSDAISGWDFFFELRQKSQSSIKNLVMLGHVLYYNSNYNQAHYKFIRTHRSQWFFAFGLWVFWHWHLPLSFYEANLFKSWPASWIYIWIDISPLFYMCSVQFLKFTFKFHGYRTGNAINKWIVW